jgi:hypothetical protein
MLAELQQESIEHTDADKWANEIRLVKENKDLQLCYNGICTEDITTVPVSDGGNST